MKVTKKPKIYIKMDQTTLNILPISLEEEMKGSYLDYAMSVIIGRALPDARDGLKPVHRRILYAMLREGLTANKKYSKCAGVVGEVLKHYHPHGDSAVYDALVRLAQPWSMRYPLIDGQGNFGSIDGDSAAAYRYTECKMETLAGELLEDIDMETVDFSPNFDDSVMEPRVLPTRIPNLLINGAEGIAVGMASRIPPHNLTEILNACLKLIDNPDATVQDLMECVPGPDFPTGGIIYGSAPLRQIYQTGRGLFQIRSKVHFETIKENKREAEAIIIDEVPYQTNKAKLIEKIAELVHEKKIEGISRLRDESDRKGMRVVIEVKRDASVEVVLNQLYKLTPMQKSFGVINLSIVDGRPRVLSLRDSLNVFLNHRRDVVVRRSKFELGKARARLHILEGYRIALDRIDEVVETIKRSESTPVAKIALQERFGFSEIQAQTILDMPLKRLTGLERRSIDEEYAEVTARILELETILASDKVVDSVIRKELVEIVERYGDERRTEIVEQGEDIDLEDMIQEEDMVVTISHKGYAKRMSPTLYKSQKRGGKGIQGAKKSEEGADEDLITELFVASTHAYLLSFTSHAKVYWTKVYSLPETSRTARGRALVNLLNLSEEEKVNAILPVREFNDKHYVVMATKLGLIKRVSLMEFSNVRNSGIKAGVFDEGDSLIAVRLTDGTQDCIISTKSGLTIRFDENDLRVMGRVTKGVRAINLADGDEVVSFTTSGHISGSFSDESEEDEVPAVEIVDGEEKVGEEIKEGEVTLLTVCENGYGKRTRLDRYRLQRRAGKGLIDIKTEGRNGSVVGTCQVSGTEDLMIITNSGKIIRIPSSGISVVGRNTMGVRLVNLDEGERVVAIARVAETEE